MKRSLFSILAILLITSGCIFSNPEQFNAGSAPLTPVAEMTSAAENNQSGGVTSFDSQLTDPVWYWRGFISMDDTHSMVVEFPQDYTLQFNLDGVLIIHSDCNLAGTRFSAQNGALTLDEIEVTTQDCGEESLDAGFIRDLGYTASYVIQDGVLYLNMAMDAGSLVFTQTFDEPIPPALQTSQPVDEIVGQIWYWQTFQSMADGMSFSIEQPQDYAILLNQDGSVFLAADCNTGGGSYVLAESFLQFTPFEVTEQDCGPDSLSARFVEDLGYVVTYVLQDNLLYLNLAMDGGNLIFSTSPEPNPSLLP